MSVEGMNVNLSVISLVTHASALVQLIMLLLLMASVASWHIIFKKMKLIQALELRLMRVEEVIEKTDWGRLNEWILAQRDAGGIVAVLRYGLREASRFAMSDLPPTVQLGYLKQLLEARLTRAAHTLEQGVPFLATVGSVSPYIGLFGTVWGIMMAFRALGASTAQATLAMVAPGISEALIATAMGLFAAIPAVIAYNRFQHAIGHLIERYELLTIQFCTFYARYLEESQTTGEPA